MPEWRRGAARSAAHDLAEFLSAHGPLDPVWALSVVEAVLANEHPDDEHPSFSGGEDLVRLVLRIYTDDGVSTEVRAHAMAVFDRLMERFAGYALTALSEWDRG